MEDCVSTDKGIKCLLHDGKLKDILSALDSLDGKMDNMLSHEGPLSRLDKRVSVVEESAKSSHHRLDTFAKALTTLADTNTMLGKEVSGMSGKAAGVAFVVSLIVMLLAGTVALVRYGG